MPLAAMRPSSLSRPLVVAGIAAPFVYAVTVIVGATLRPEYSHIANAVSELIERGAPNKAVLDVAFVLYDLLLIAFGAGVIGLAASSRAIRTSGWLIVASGGFGVVAWGFPMDPVGTPGTFTGMMHLVLAGLMSLSTMAAIVSFAIGVRRRPGWRGFSNYSLATFAVVLVSGAAGAIGAAQAWPTMGLWERVTIGSAILWMMVLAIILYRQVRD
jgi:hypothetical membrane protein